MHVTLTDRDANSTLVELARTGDTAAIVGIMRRHNRRLFRTAQAILRNAADAEDAVQDAYIRAFGALDDLMEPEHLATWLTRIVVNESLRRQARRGPVPDEPQPPEAATPPWNDPEAITARAEIRRMVEAAINRLPDKLRTVFILRAVEEFSVEEAASMLGVPADTVKTRLFRARGALKQTLSRQLSSVLSDTFPFDGARCDRLIARVLSRLDFKHPAGPRPG